MNNDPTLFEEHIPAFLPDISLYYCGKRIETPNHVYGPEIRSHYLLVFVEKGHAILYRKNKKLHFCEGQMLVMFPGESIYYKAQTNWSIRWVGVKGTQIDELFSLLNITPHYPLWTIPEPQPIIDILEKIYTAQKRTLTVSNQYKTSSLLFELFSLMLSSTKEQSLSTNQNNIIHLAKKIIKYNYNNKLSISQIAKKLYLSPAYFSRIFKEKTGISPQQYLTDFRIEKAKELLRTNKHNIKTIAFSLGFDDPLYFSKLFIKKVGCSPSEWQKRNS